MTIHVLHTLFISGLIFCASCAPISTVKTPSDQELEITFEAKSGEVVQAYRGQLTVPENRNVEDSRDLTLHYIRFPATGNPGGSPIIYLAGGPGGSGIEAAKYDRFPLFMAMREFGDVIAFDQRGTGDSNDLPNCTSSQTISVTEPTEDVTVFDLERVALAECLEFWRAEGIDPRGYTTVQNAYDLESLREHLGAEKISLWGISYGSHLSLAALKQMDDRIDRVVIAAVEGVSQTVKLPKRGDMYFERFQAAINTVPEAKAKYPDIMAMIGRVLNALEANPLLLQIPTQNGETLPYLLQKRDMQKFTSALAMDPPRMAMMLNVYKSLENGDKGPLVDLLRQGIDPTDTAISFRPMTVLMDIASGTDEDRYQLISEQARTASLGQHMNFSLHLESVEPDLVLEDSFRQMPVSDRPVLVLSGTLDGRTYVESGQEATAGLSNRQTVIVENGGHNLFMLSPEVTETIQRFMRGESVDGEKIRVDLPDF